MLFFIIRSAKISNLGGKWCHNFVIFWLTMLLWKRRKEQEANEYDDEITQRDYCLYENWIRWWQNIWLVFGIVFVCKEEEHENKQLIETYRFIYRSLSSSTENIRFFSLLCLQGTDVKRIQLNLIIFFSLDFGISSGPLIQFSVLLVAFIFWRFINWEWIIFWGISIAIHAMCMRVWAFECNLKRE